MLLEQILPQPALYIVLEKDVGEGFRYGERVCEIVCVCERERDRGRDREREKYVGCVCVGSYVWVCLCVRWCVCV